MKAQKNGEHLLVYLNGEIDHCCAETLRRDIEDLLRDQKIIKLTLDFSRVSFMDSSGVGMLIGRYKTMAARHGSINAQGLRPPVRKLFHMAGLHRIIAEREEGRENDEK